MSNDLSLIVPSYNSGKYLIDLINSVFGGNTSLGAMTEQTLLPDEVIIVDDCSTDNTEEVVRDLLQFHKEIKYFRLSRNSGTAIACNVAIEQASGKYITRIDADDMRERWSFEHLMMAQLANPHSYIYDNVMIFLNGQRTGREWNMYDYDFHKLLERNSNHAGIMFPKKAWVECGGYPPEFNDGRDDWSFNVALGVVGYCGIHIGRAGYLYRREQQNRTIKNASSERQMYYRRKMENHFPEIYSGRFPMGCCGNRTSKKTVVASSNSQSQILVGADGMTLIMYDGENYGIETYFGPVTGAAYQFSKKKNIRNVDSRDLHTERRNGLLDLSDHGKPIFHPYQTPTLTPVVPSIEKSIVEEPVVEESVVEESTEDSNEIHLIESGQITGITKKVIAKLTENGISSWESFLSEDSASLSGITGLTVERIDEIKQEISS